MRMRREPVRVFVSYSHQDEYWMKKLMPLFESYRASIKVEPFTDREVMPGDQWDQRIQRSLEEMHIFVALVSFGFATSPYIRKVECRIARKRLRKGEIKVVPIYVGDPGGSDCDWLFKHQRLPPAKSWGEIEREYPNYDEALPIIRRGIWEVLRQVVADRTSSTAPFQDQRPKKT